MMKVNAIVVPDASKVEGRSVKNHLIRPSPAAISANRNNKIMADFIRAAHAVAEAIPNPESVPRKCHTPSPAAVKLNRDNQIAANKHRAATALRAAPAETALRAADDAVHTPSPTAVAKNRANQLAANKLRAATALRAAPAETALRAADDAVSGQHHTPSPTAVAKNRANQLAANKLRRENYKKQGNSTPVTSDRWSDQTDDEDDVLPDLQLFL
jgi:hypothetical protein